MADMHQDDYAFDLTSIAAHVAGIAIYPDFDIRMNDGQRIWVGFTDVQLRAATRNVHCLVGCLDAPMDDLVGTS